MRGEPDEADLSRRKTLQYTTARVERGARPAATELIMSYGVKEFSEVPSDYVPGDGELHAILHTNHGDIDVLLYDKRAPKTVANFVGLATGQRAWTDPDTFEPGNGPYYDGVIFHRVIKGFMIQGGDRMGTGRGGPGYRFADEFHRELVHDGPGVLSMANAGPNTNGSQFFITEKATPHLDGRHAVFGRVVGGLDAMMSIANTRTGRGDRPVEDAVIKSITIERR